jgi:predicted Rossmann-fold nucleotide-binding protein
MAKPAKFKTPSAPPMTPEQAERMAQLFDQAVHKFSGTFDELESALGMYVLGRHVGWKVLFILHSKKTVKKYEEILGISVREEFPEEGPEALRSVGYSIAKKFSNFWKVVSGEEKVDRTNWREIQ